MDADGARQCLSLSTFGGREVFFFMLTTHQLSGPGMNRIMANSFIDAMRSGLGIWLVEQFTEEPHPTMPLSSLIEPTMEGYTRLTTASFEWTLLDGDAGRKIVRSDSIFFGPLEGPMIDIRGVALVTQENQLGTLLVFASPFPAGGGAVFGNYLEFQFYGGDVLP